MKSITVTRNALVVGHNSKSYDDKHPTPTITFRPIKTALRSCRGIGNAHLRSLILGMRNWNKPDMLRGIAQALRGPVWENFASALEAQCACEATSNTQGGSNASVDPKNAKGHVHRRGYQPTPGTRSSADGLPRCKPRRCATQRVRRRSVKSNLTLSTCGKRHGSRSMSCAITTTPMTRIGMSGWSVLILLPPMTTPGICMTRGKTTAHTIWTICTTRGKPRDAPRQTEHRLTHASPEDGSARALQRSDRQRAGLHAYRRTPNKRDLRWTNATQIVWHFDFNFGEEHEIRK